MLKTITISTSKKEDFVDITSKVNKIVSESGVKEGICILFTPHATGAITINENADPNVPFDILKALDEIIPQGKWKHDKIDNNAAAHIKSSIIGPSQTIPIKNGYITLGTWQAIMFCEFDGPRGDRRIMVKIIKG